jgi:hypothetical protein
VEIFYEIKSIPLDARNPTPWECESSLTAERVMTVAALDIPLMGANFIVLASFISSVLSSFFFCRNLQRHWFSTEPVTNDVASTALPSINAFAKKVHQKSRWE